MVSGATRAPRKPVRRASITVSHEAHEYLAGLPVVPDLVAGARNAIVQCLEVQAGQQVVLVADGTVLEVASALLRAATEAGAEVVPYLVGPEQTTNEPFIARLLTRLEDADASILACSATGVPAAFRNRMINAGGARRRHAHMVGVTGAMMRQSMRADYREVHALGDRLIALFGPESTIEVTTPLGTDLTIRCDPTCRWENGSGLQHEPGWSYLPGGQVFTTPRSVDGRLTADAGIWLPDGQEMARSSRIVLLFQGGELTGIEGGGDDGAALLELLDAAPHGRRVGQVGFGTNIGVLTPIGAMLQDLKMPGFHIVLGHTWPERTGAKWSCSIEVPLLSRRPDVRVDGTPVMVRGRFARSLV